MHAVRWPSAPSFGYKDAELRRLREHSLAAGADHPVWSVNDKDAAHRWAASLGVRTPPLLAQVPSAHDVPWSDLPDAVVVKPVRGAGGRGVILLRRSAAGGFVDVATGRSTEPADVVDRLAATPGPVVLEEMLLDPSAPDVPPVDWKVHTFHGRIGVVAGKSHRRTRDGGLVVRWRIFDEHWRDLGAALDRHPLDRTISRPRHGEELLRVARLVSRAVPRPFLRVDLYDTADGVVFGEVTPAPGGHHVFRRDVDRRLGVLWEQAEAELMAEVAATGQLEPRWGLSDGTAAGVGV